jgi:hypothetical protein
MLRVARGTFEKVPSETFLGAHGDINERLYWPYLSQQFPNYETFWQKHVVPITKRIEFPPYHPEYIRAREGIDEHLEEIAQTHYSVFMNLIQAHKRLETPDLSYFEDFYAHLSTACDLAESFWFKIYLLVTYVKEGSINSVLKLIGINKDDVIQEIERHERRFVKRAEEWELAPPFIFHPLKSSVLKDFFSSLNKADNLREYRRFSQLIRQYRNVMIHHPQIGSIEYAPGLKLVPRKEKINNYRRWKNVFSAVGNMARLRRDFIDIGEQMTADIRTLEIFFDRLWDGVLDILEPLRTDRRYLGLQNIELV